MTAADLLASVSSDSAPPPALQPLAKALWLAKKGDWDAAHNIAQDVHSTDGSWVHALLHLIEGDSGNAASIRDTAAIDLLRAAEAASCSASGPIDAGRQRRRPQGRKDPL